MYIWIYAVILAVLILLSVLLAPVKLRIIAYLNVLNGAASYFTVKLWFIPVYSASIKLRGADIVLCSAKNKCENIKVIRINANKSDKDSIVNYLDNAFFGLIDFRKLDIFFRAGKSDSAMFTALAASGARIAVSVLFGILKTRYAGIEVGEGTEYAFNADTLTVAANGIISLSLADIIVGLIYAYRKKVKTNNEQRKTNNECKKLN